MTCCYDSETRSVCVCFSIKAAMVAVAGLDFFTLLIALTVYQFVPIFIEAVTFVA